MTRLALALACVAVAAGLMADGTTPTAAVTGTASTVPEGFVQAPEPSVVPRLRGGQSGIEYALGLTVLSVFNGSPLSYTPFEMGWRFANGLHLRTGIDLFYYEGSDSDAKQPDQGVQRYYYEMQDWRTSLLYTVPLPGRLHPLAGASLEVVQGTRRLAGADQISPPIQSSWGFLGPGAILGAEWRFNDHWSTELQGRYVFSFGAAGTVSALGLNTVYLF